MLMSASFALLDSITAQSDRLKAGILSALHELKSANLYYVSPDGDDCADGRSPATAWRSLARAEQVTVDSGSPDAEVLFERGGIWRGSLRAKAGVTYSAYGSGEKPRIYGSPFDGARTGSWSEVAPDVWRYSEKLYDDCGCIVMDGGAYNAVKLVVNYEGDPVDNITREPFRGLASLTGDLDFWHDLGGASLGLPPNGIPAVSIPPSGTPSGGIQSDGSSGAESGAGYIYLCSKFGNPAERFREIEFLPRRNIISIGGDGVTVDNLTVMYGGAHGIGSGTTRGLTVTNCVIGWIGGSLQFYRSGRPTRFGNGVEIYGGCDGYTIDHCRVYQVYDAGITHQLSTGGDSDCTMKHVRYTNNLIEYCTYSIEYFLGKAARQDAVRAMSDIDMRHNILRFAGYGWGDQRPNKAEAAHFKGWDSENRTDGSFTIEENIVECSRYMLLHCGAGDKSDCPVLRQNTFLQYAGGELGRYGANPTKLMAYICQNVTGEEFLGNEFYIIDND